MRKGLISLLSIGLLLIGWQVLATLFDQPELIPSLPRLLKTLIELLVSADFYKSAAATIGRGLMGILLSLVAASGLAWVSARYEIVYELFRPLLTIMRSIPVISFILLALIFLSPEKIPLIIAFLTMFPLLTENLTRGICHLRSGFSVMARQFRLGCYNRITQIVYPQLKPFLYSGLASAMGFGWRAIIMGEVLAQCHLGIGSEMKKAQNYIAVPELMAWTVIAIMISFVFDKGLTWLSLCHAPIRYNRSEKINSSRESFPTATDPTPIQLTNIGYTYGTSSFTYVFRRGVVYGITAPSGAGKTTLLNLINGTLSPIQGEVTMSHNSGIASVFQEPELLPHMTARENIALPLARNRCKEESLGQADIFLHEVEMSSFANRYPDELSFGQQQRIALARALAYPSPILLMDEPFKGLDEELCNRIIERIRQRQAENHQTILFTTHSPDELRLLADERIYFEE